VVNWLAAFAKQFLCEIKQGALGMGLASHSRDILDASKVSHFLGSIN
jgi:hypothetical protein